MTQHAYHVSWEIDIDADSPEDAAREALRMQRDPDSLAVVFNVSCPELPGSVMVDLYHDTDAS